METAIDTFLALMGEPTSPRPVTDETLSKYASVFPKVIPELWKRVGLSGFHNGLFWLTDPGAYAGAVDRWLIQPGFVKQEQCWVLARSAFGDCWLWSERRGLAFKIVPTWGWVIENSFYTRVALDQSAMRFVESASPNRGIDPKDENDEPLFERARDSLGDLSEDEMYAFRFLPGLGCPITLENLVKVNIHVQLDIAAQLLPIEYRRL